MAMTTRDLFGFVGTDSVLKGELEYGAQGTVEDEYAAVLEDEELYGDEDDSGDTFGEEDEAELLRDARKAAKRKTPGMGKKERQRKKIIADLDMGKISESDAILAIRALNTFPTSSAYFEQLLFEKEKRGLEGYEPDDTFGEEDDEIDAMFEELGKEMDEDLYGSVSLVPAHSTSEPAPTLDLGTCPVPLPGRNEVMPTRQSSLPSTPTVLAFGYSAVVIGSLFGVFK